MAIFSTTLDIGCHYRFTRRLLKEDLKAHCISSCAVFPKFYFPKHWKLQLSVVAVSVFIFLYSRCQHGIWVRCPLVSLILYLVEFLFFSCLQERVLYPGLSSGVRISTVSQGKETLIHLLNEAWFLCKFAFAFLTSTHLPPEGWELVALSPP